jgi:hypothetical protein
MLERSLYTVERILFVLGLVIVVAAAILFGG